MTEAALKVAALAVAAALCTVTIRKAAPEVSLVLVLAGGTVILLGIWPVLSEIVQAKQRMAQMAQLEAVVLQSVAKTVAISVLTKITGELCRSSGESGLAAFVETAGTVLALGVAIPLAEGVLELMGQLLS